MVQTAVQIFFVTWQGDAAIDQTFEPLNAARTGDGFHNCAVEMARLFNDFNKE